MPKFIVFTKIFGRMEPERVAEHVYEIGFDGADLLVREGGTVDPNRVDTELPQAIETMRARGLSVPLVTTDISSPDDPLLEKVLRTCRQMEVGKCRLGWWRYDVEKDHRQQWEEGRRQLTAIGEIASRHGVVALLQIHGRALHVSPTRTAHFVKDIPKDHVGIYFDPGNMMKEGFEQWPLSVAMVKDRLRMVGVKNCGWYADESSPVRWRSPWVGLDQGIVDWDGVFRLLCEAGYDEEYSLHPFYESIPLEQAIEQMRKDLAFARSRVRAHLGATS